MKVIDVYQQYFEAECEWNGTPRKAADCRLTAVSDEGRIVYTLELSFFPHEDAEDFRITSDAYISHDLFDGKGRRSRKKEAAFMETMREEFNKMAEKMDGKVFWDKPLIEARLG